MSVLYTSNIYSALPDALLVVLALFNLFLLPKNVFFCKDKQQLTNALYILTVLSLSLSVTTVTTAFSCHECVNGGANI